MVMILFFNRAVPAKPICLPLRRGGVLVLLRLLLVPLVRSDAQRPRPESRLHMADGVRAFTGATISMGLSLIVIPQLGAQGDASLLTHNLLLLPDLVRDAQLCQVLEHVGLARLEDLRRLVNVHATILVGPSAYLTNARMLLI